jgi:hypothetical protein
VLYREIVILELHGFLFFGSAVNIVNQVIIVIIIIITTMTMIMS